MEINHAAPVVATGELVIGAEPEAVWDVLTDFESWPAWNPEVKSMTFEGEVAPGSEFRWKAGPGTIVSTIQQVERPRLISWSGKTLGMAAVHVYRLEPRDGSTLVKTEESFDGLLARVARGPLRRTLTKSLDAGLRHLSARVEEPRRVADA